MSVALYLVERHPDVNILRRYQSPAFKETDFLELVARERMTHSRMVPEMRNPCLLAAAFDETKYAAWRITGYRSAHGASDDRPLR